MKLNFEKLKKILTSSDGEFQWILDDDDYVELPFKTLKEVIELWLREENV